MIEKYKTNIEFLMLVIAIVYGAVFIYRTWPYPSADYDLEVLDRMSTGKGFDYLVVKNNFVNSDSANLHKVKFTYQCEGIGKTTLRCENFCSEAMVQPEDGVLSRNDALHWSCIYKVPTNSCVSLSHSAEAESFGIVSTLTRWGIADIFGLKPALSYWKTSIISCT